MSAQPTICSASHFRTTVTIAAGPTTGPTRWWMPFVVRHTA